MKRIRFILIAYFLMIPVVSILPFYSLESYSILKSTMSHLAAQNPPNPWIMNVKFCFLCVATTIEGRECLKKYWFHKIVLLVFGLSRIFTAIYQHAPFEPNILLNIKSDELQSLFATICGWSFVTFAVSSASTIFALISSSSGFILRIPAYQSDRICEILQGFCKLSFNNVG